VECQDPIQDLLPWYVNDTLTVEERNAVEAHLRECIACHEREAVYRMLAEELKARTFEASLPGIPSLLAQLPQQEDRRRHLPKSVPSRPDKWWPWLLLRAQERVVRREIWVASTLVMALGTLVTLATYGPHSPSGSLPLVLISPIVAAIGVAFIYGPAVDPALEIELATPASTRLILLARLVLIFGFNLALGLMGSVVLAGLRSEVSLWPLVMAWLAPMAFLSALAFMLTILLADPGIGVLVSLGLWAVQSMGQVVTRSGISWNLPDLTAVEVRPWLWALTLLFFALALWASGRDERWLRRPI
jgi:hypothetical protein